ncbi:MAG: class II aldolase/adducin family protein [Rhodobacteraceae bacterium]|nr:class II aldolase/adducin family protein [Paracoccaceae bacterium]
MTTLTNPRPNLAHWQARVDLAAAFRWTERLGMHEAVANHFSLAINDAGTEFLMNPNQMYFGRIRASDLLLLDANNPDCMKGTNAPDPTAWGLHSALHRQCPHARCVMHVHSTYATILASLADSTLPPIDQNTAMFFNRHVVDEGFGGLAFESEGQRCAAMLEDPKIQVMVMGNHGILVIGDSVADSLNRMYYFERAAQTYIGALQTGRPLRRLADTIAEKTAQQIASYPDQARSFLREIKAVLDASGSDYRT